MPRDGFRIAEVVTGDNPTEEHRQVTDGVGGKATGCLLEGNPVTVVAHVYLRCLCVDKERAGGRSNIEFSALPLGGPCANKT